METPPRSSTSKNSTPLSTPSPTLKAPGFAKTPRTFAKRMLVYNFNPKSPEGEQSTIQEIRDKISQNQLSPNKIYKIEDIIKLLEESKKGGTLRLSIPNFFKRVKEFDDFIYASTVNKNISKGEKLLVSLIIREFSGAKNGFILRRLDRLSISANEKNIDSVVKKVKQIKQLNDLVNDIEKLKTEMFRRAFLNKLQLLIGHIREYILTDLSRITNLKNIIPNSLTIKPSELNRKKSEILAKYSSSRIERNDIRKLLLQKNKDLNTLRAFDLFSTADIKTFEKQILKQLGFSIERVYRDILSDQKRKLKDGNIRDLKGEIYSYQKSDINVSDILRILQNFKQTKSNNTNTYKNKNKLFNAYVERLKLNNNITISNSNKKFLSNRPDLLFRLDTEKKKYEKGKRERVFKTYNIIKKEQLDEYKKSGKEKPMSYFKNRYGFTNAQLKEIKSKNYLNNIKNEYVNTNRKYYKQFISIRMKYWDNLKTHLIKKYSGNKNYSKTIRDITTEYKNNVDKLNEGYGRTYASKMKKKIMKHIRPREQKIQQKLKRVADKLKKM
jgi:hypothetical protein